MTEKQNTTATQPSITLNGDVVLIQPEETISSLLNRLEFNQRGIAVEVNQKVISREQHSNHLLQSGDWLEVVTLVGGG